MLPKLSENQSERRHSPRYRPAPWGDRELGELLDTGLSTRRAARLKRKNARATTPSGAGAGEEGRR